MNAWFVRILYTYTHARVHAAHIVAILGYVARLRSRDSSAGAHINLNLKRTTLGNVKTTLGLVLAALQVILVPSTNVRRIANSLIHEPFEERLLLTGLRARNPRITRNVSPTRTINESRLANDPPPRARASSVAELSDPRADRARARRASAHPRLAVVADVVADDDAIDAAIARVTHRARHAAR